MTPILSHPSPAISFWSRIPFDCAAVRLFLLLCLLGTVALPTGCGFKLRGTVEIPEELNPMYVQSNGGSKVRKAIMQQLEFSQVRLSASAADARIVLRILGESRSSRVAAVDQNGKVVARELFLTVRFDAVDAKGAPLVEAQRLNLSRTYEDPDVEVLGKQLEADLIYEDLVQDAADRILTRLRAVLL